MRADRVETFHETSRGGRAHRRASKAVCAARIGRSAKLIKQKRNVRNFLKSGITRW